MKDENRTSKYRPEKLALPKMKEMAASLAEVETMLIDTVNYGDFLEEQIRFAEEDSIELENQFTQHFERAFESEIVKSGKDAKKREITAKNLVSIQWEAWQKAKAIVGELKGYAKTNNSKSEALRSILSTRKTVFEKVYNNLGKL